MKCVVAAAVAACLMSGSSVADAGERLSDKEIKRLMPGRIHAEVLGNKIAMTARAGGRLVARWADDRDTGVWRVSDGKLCITFSKWLSGATRCSAVTRSGGWFSAAGVRFRKL